MRTPMEQLLEALRNKWPNTFPTQKDLSHEDFLRLQGVHEAIRFIEERKEHFETQALTRGRIR